MRCLVCCLLTLAGLANPAAASVIPIAGYDINDAVVSGHGNWAHTYNGLITPLGNFVNNSFGGMRATYSGVGSGTLNDGIIGSSLQNSQLFMGGQATDQTLFDPAIYLTLSNAYTIDRIDLYGGDIVNGIPGEIAAVTVSLLKTDFTVVSETFVTTPFGTFLNSLGDPVNDRIDLTGSSLAGVGAYGVWLTAFQGSGDVIDDGIDNSFSRIGGWFSLTEIELNGELVPQENNAVPEPASIATMASTLLLGGFGLYWRKRRAG